jgi:hypothetical protein
MQVPFAEYRAMTNKPSAEEILGPPPWDEEKLVRAYLADFPRILDAIHTHPGYEIHAELEALMLSRRIFDRSIDELAKAVQSFEQYSLTPDFRSPGPKQVYEDRCFAVQATLFHAASSAIALKARAKTLDGRFSVPGFEARIKSSFEKNARHQFISHLRGHLDHVGPLSPEWHLSWSAKNAPQQTRFLLYVDDLLNIAKKGHRWDSLAISFIEGHRGKPTDNLGKSGAIDILAVFKDYKADVTAFYDWQNNSVEQCHDELLQSYRETEKRFYRVAGRMGLKAIVLPVLEQGDPLVRLKMFLTATDIATIDSLPKGSNEQIGAIINCINQDNNLVDDDIEARLRRIFRSGS